MGLFTQKDLTEDWALSMADVPRLCFLCGDPLAVPCIFWMGCSDQNTSQTKILGVGRSQIWLHPYCASILATKLTADWFQFLHHEIQRRQ